MHPALAPAIAAYVDADRRRASLDAHRALMPHVESPAASRPGRIHRVGRALAGAMRRPERPTPATLIGTADPC